MGQAEWPSSTLRRRVKPAGILLAATSVLAALGTWVTVARMLDERDVFPVFLLSFTFATVVTALYGGFWPGMLALGLSVAAGAFAPPFFRSPPIEAPNLGL